MKRSLILFAVALTAALSSAPLACPATAQELTVNYRVTFNADSDQMKAMFEGHEKIGAKFREIYRNMVLTFQLVYKDGVSSFKTIPTEEKHTVKILGMEVDVNNTIASELENTWVYKDHGKGIILNRIEEPRKSFVVTDVISPEPYVVDEDAGTLEILGHVCRKAVSPDGEMTVWISCDFALRDEPFLCGLDGLILDYDDGLKHFTAVSIEESAAFTPEVPQAEITMTRAEYDAKYNK